MRKIVCAACKYVNYLFLAPRHFDTTMHLQIGMMGMVGEVRMHKGLIEQGFIDNEGNFLDRKEAYIVAKAANQITRKENGYDDEELYSEDLY